MMVTIDIERANLARRIYDLTLEANAAWSYAIRRSHTMAAEYAEHDAMEADDERFRLLAEYREKYGCYPQGTKPLPNFYSEGE
jgi:predicted ArsR family transcriptional regulator